MGRSFHQLTSSNDGFPLKLTPSASKLNRPLLTRRQWLGKAPASALATAAAMSLLAEHTLAAKPTSHATPASDLGSRIYNIRDFGAKGDGVALDTAAVQTAIDTCTHDGGGTVLVPVGTFQIGTVELKSNVPLHIAAGGKLLGSSDGKQYHCRRRHSLER